MNKTRLLWMLIAADVLLAFATVGADAFFAWTLPTDLAIYKHRQFAGEWGPWMMFQLMLLATNVLFAFAAWTSMVLFFRYARELYLVSWGFWISFTLVSG